MFWWYLMLMLAFSWLLLGIWYRTIWKCNLEWRTTLSVPFFYPNFFFFLMPFTRTRNCLILTFEWFLSEIRSLCLSEFLQHQIFSWNARGSIVFDRDYSLYIWNDFYVNSWSILCSQEPESLKRIKSSTTFCKQLTTRRPTIKCLMCFGSRLFKRTEKLIYSVLFLQQ